MLVPGGSILLGGKTGPVGWIAELAGTSAAYFLGIGKLGANVIAVGTNNFSSTSSGDTEVVALKDIDGTVVWQEKVNTVSSQSSGNLVIDSAGKIRFVAPEYATSYNIQATSLNSDGSLNNAGKLVMTGWAGTQGVMDVDASNNLYSVGKQTSSPIICKFDSTGAFVAAAKSSVNYAQNVQVACNATNLAFAQDNNADGTLSLLSITNDLSTINWQKKLSGTGGNPRNVVADASNNIYLLSSTSAGVSWLHKFDSLGNHTWSVSLTLTGLVLVGIAPNSSGIAVAGFSGSASAGYLAQFDTSGNVLWQSKFTNSASNPEFNDLRASGNNLYAAADRGVTVMVAMKLPYLTAPPNGTFGNWTIATATIVVAAATPTITTPSISLSTPTASGSSATPTVTATSLTPANIPL